MNIKHNADLMDEFIENYDSPNKYREGVDYRIASHSFPVLEDGIHTLRRLESKSPTEAGSKLFYLLNQEVDYFIAHNFGFGVVKFRSGKHKGKEALYYFNQMGGNRKTEEESVREVLAISSYLQYMNPNYISHGVKTLLKTNESIMRKTVYKEEDAMIKTLKQITQK